MSDQAAHNIVNVTARIVAAHLANNHVDASALPSLIQSVYRTLSSVGEQEVTPTTAQQPAVPAKKSVFHDFIICLEDGKMLKMRKRHLQTSYGITPDDYRAKWGLARDYPMVAPSYTSTRSGIAKQFGLGRRADEVPAKPEATQPPARPARNSKGSTALSPKRRKHSLVGDHGRDLRAMLPAAECVENMRLERSLCSLVYSHLRHTRPMERGL